MIAFLLFLASSLMGQQTVTTPPQTAFSDMRLGLFVHYTYVGRPYKWGCTTWSDGSPVASLDELADNLDVENLARTAAAMRAQYLQFTTWHANMNVLFPSGVMARKLPGHCSRRDVIGDLIKALRPTGIKLILYIHPSDGHDFSREDQDRVGWNDGPGYARWNDFVNAVIAEVVDRYGADVAGYWIDGGLPAQVDPARLRETILSRDPEAWLIQNSGLNRICVDFGAHETFAEPYTATEWQMNAVISGEWWAKQGFLRVSPEMALKYTVLQAGVTGNAGGVAWSVGPHPGGRWETGVPEFAQRLGEHVRRIEPALFGTRPSAAYPTSDGTPLRSARVVGTESQDGKTTYLHVLWPPQGKELALPVPADGRKFAEAVLLGGGEVRLSQNADGVTLRLGEGQAWDLVDTVVLLRSSAGDAGRGEAESFSARHQLKEHV
jgi:hypothetical protein